MRCDENCRLASSRSATVVRRGGANADRMPPDVKKDIQIEIQSPIKTAGAVPVADEPHHAHVFQNGYVQVYNVTVPPLDATLLYRHDLPYLF